MIHHLIEFPPADPLAYHTPCCVLTWCWTDSGPVVQGCCCVTLCKTRLHFLSALVGLSGTQPGNYTALTTSPERKAHCLTHTNSILITLPPAHTHASSPSQTQGLRYVKQDYNDSNLTRRCSCSASGVSVPEFTV